MGSLLSVLISWPLSVINNLGYTGIFILSALESAGIPIPSEIVVPFSGFLTTEGKFSLWGIVLVATLANVFGSLILFIIGRSGGRWILERYGKYVLIGKTDLDIGDRLFDRYGARIVFWGRLLPVVRTFISLPAGVAKMKPFKFVLFTALGALPWNFVLAEVGVKMKQNWVVLHDYFQKFDIIILLAIVVIVVWYIYRHLKKHG